MADEDCRAANDSGMLSHARSGLSSLCAAWAKAASCAAAPPGDDAADGCWGWMFSVGTVAATEGVAGNDTLALAANAAPAPAALAGEGSGWVAG